jgi:hypothetical protein
MAEPDDKAFLKEFGGYKPQTTSVPVATIRPVISFESEEEVAARRADEARKGRGAEIEEERLDISKRAEATGLEDTRRKGFLDLVTKYEGDANVVKYQKVLPIYNTMLTVASKPNPSKADDNLLVTYFSKIKDPATGVLGGEFETSKDVQTAYDKAVVDLQGLYDPKVGFVSPAARRQFIRATNDLVASDRQAYQFARNRYRQIATEPEFGQNPDAVIGEDFANTYVDQIKENYLKVMAEPTAETAGGVPVLKVAEGDKFSTDKDIAIASELQGMWAAGRTLDEVNAKAIELTGGNPLSAETVKALSEDPQRTIRFTPNRSGIREPSAPGMETAIGTAAVRGFTSNLGEEILSTVFDSPVAAAQLQAAGEYGMENYPITSMLAEIPSSIVSPVNKLTKFIPGGPVVRDIFEGGIYGGGEGRPDASALERFKTGAAGSILQSGFGAAARRFMPGGAAPDGMAPDGSGIPEGEFVNVTGEVPTGMAPEMPMGAAPAPSAVPTGAPTGMAPPTAGMAAPTGATPDMAAIDDEALDVGREAMIELARKAVSRGPGASKARAELAELAKIDPEAQAAAERLGIQLPVDVLGQNAQLQRVTGLARSQIGSDVETAWRKTYNDAAERAFKAMDELGAVKDISQLSKNVFDKLDTANKGLEIQADDLRKQVNGAIDVAGRVDASAIRSYLEEQIRKLGGGTEGLKELSKEEKKLWAMVSKGNPTYEALDKKRAEIGRAMTKNSGPWVDSNAQRINDIYAKLADDQMGFIESSAGKEIADKQRAANTLFKQMYDGRGQMQEIFGRNLSKDLGPLITTAITQGGKGGVEAINKLLTNIPENMRGTVLTSGLFSTATDAKGGFSFANFANTYSKLREQSQVFNQFAKAIGPDGVNLLNDFNAIGRRIANAQANIIPTGAANQLNALNAENLMLKILQGVGAAGAGAAATSVLGADLIQTVGGIIAAGGGAAFAQLKSKNNVQKLHDLMKSDKFRELAVSAATGEGVDRNINRVAGSKEFRDYAKLVGIDMKDARDWLNSAISKGATIVGTEAVGSKPDEAPTVEMPQ